jgi:hypothetical protein
MCEKKATPRRMVQTGWQGNHAHLSPMAGFCLLTDFCSSLRLLPKNHMKTLFYIAFVTALLTVNPAVAQQFFTPGYAITTQGDTLRGEIKAKGNKTILIRETGKTPERIYTPDQIAAYTTENTNHVAATLTEDSTTTRLFLREWVSGYVGLYGLNSPDGELAYALRLPDESFVPLRGKKAWMVLNRNLTECTDPTFLAKLDANLYIYSRLYFEQLVMVYNHCVKPDKVSKRPKSPFHFEFGPLLGVARNQWNYTAEPSNFYFNPNGLYPAYNTFVAGGFITLMPRKRLSMTVEMLFSEYKGERSVPVTNPPSPVVLDTRIYSFQEQFLTVPISARYVVIDRAVRWYLKGGGSLTYELTLQGQVGSDLLANADIPMRKAPGVGYLLGIGVDIPLSAKRHVFAEIRTMTHVVKNGANDAGNSRSGQFVVGIPLFVR